MNEVTPESKFQASFGNDLVQTAKVHLNLGQDVIIITEDKLRLCLRDYQDCFASKQGWITPASVGLGVLLVFLTSSFHDFFLPANTWQAIFVIVGIVCFFWTLGAGLRAFRNRKSVEDLITEVKTAAEAEAEQTQDV